MTRLARSVAVFAAATCSLALVSTPALAHGGSSGGHTRPSVSVIASGLDGPRQLSRSGHSLYVAESDSGEVSRISLRTGNLTSVVTGLGLGSPSGAVKVDGRFVMLTGGPAPDSDVPPGPYPAASVLVAKPGHKPRVLADLQAYELKYNPDGQRQFDDAGVPLDALSNPYYVVGDHHRRGGVIVADAGANALLRVSASGRVTTFFVPPVVNTGACAGLVNNDPQHVGCDAVPTGLAYGPGHTLYVSALTAEVPGEGRVYVLDARTGRQKGVITGLSGPTGVAVDHRGTVYVSELLEGASDAPDADPSTMGQIVRIPRCAQRTYAQVTMPSGLLWSGGRLYASTNSLIPGAGQVVAVRSSAFKPPSS